MRITFRALGSFNYRIWSAGSLVSNVGTWMQRIAQDWLVLTQLTHNNATAVGIVMGLQFGPQVLLLPLTGFAADHLNRRKLMIATQMGMGGLALALGLLTVSGWVRLWQVYGFAFLLGCLTAFDSPARQTFVSEMVPDEDLANAVALNSTSFNVARLIGPALAAVLIGTVGSGWVFVINAASFAAAIGSLRALRVHELHAKPRILRTGAGLIDGFRYVRQRPDLTAALAMFFLVGTFGLNFPIFISTMSVSVFHTGARGYALLTSVMAVGSIAGALIAARRQQPHAALLCAATATLAVGFALAAIMPTYALFAASLVIVGVAAQTFTTSATSAVQLATDPAMRGRVMAILLAVAMGGTPLGAPFVGWVADRFGPRWALGVGAVTSLAAALVSLRYLAKHRRLRWQRGRWRFEFDEP